MGFYRKTGVALSILLQKDDREVMLAQEQEVMMRPGGRAKELEGEFGLGGEVEGTLILTNRRLIFVTTNEREEDLPEPTALDPWAKVALSYSDVEDLSTIPEDPKNTFIPIAAITQVKGHKGVVGPRLDVTWSASGATNSMAFTEELTGHRNRNLNDWAAVIERLRAGTQVILDLPKPPQTDSLEGKAFAVLSDMQEKGVMTIVGGIGDDFKQEVDPDEVEDACDRLAEGGLVEKRPDSSGDVFYRKRSPLGPDDLST